MMDQHPSKTPKKKAGTPPRSFRIYREDQRIEDIDAPSLRTALRNCETPENEILAAVDISCLPSPEKEQLPFLAVFLRNGNFIPPERV